MPVPETFDPQADYAIVLARPIKHGAMMLRPMYKYIVKGHVAAEIKAALASAEKV